MNIQDIYHRFINRKQPVTITKELVIDLITASLTTREAYFRQELTDIQKRLDALEKK